MNEPFQITGMSTPVTRRVKISKEERKARLDGRWMLEHGDPIWPTFLMASETPLLSNGWKLKSTCPGEPLDGLILFDGAVVVNCLMKALAIVLDWSWLFHRSRLKCSEWILTSASQLALEKAVANSLVAWLLEYRRRLPWSCASGQLEVLFQLLNGRVATVVSVALILLRDELSNNRGPQ